MKALVLGSSGFLGSYLGFALPRLGWDTHGVSRTDAPWFPRNHRVTSGDDIEALVRSGDYDVVINAVAIASHEACEADPEAAWEVNATLPARFAGACLQAGSRFVHISTDAVFDGEARSPYTEDDVANPGSVYGRSKLSGENAVLEANSLALVVRTNFFGWSRSGAVGILDFFVSAFENSRPITGFTDYRVSSLYVGHLVTALVGALERGAAGVHHIVAAQGLSKFDFGLVVAEECGLDPSSMAPGELESASHLSSRGQNLELSTAKIEAVLRRPMESSRDGVRLAVREKSLVMDYFGHTATARSTS